MRSAKDYGNFGNKLNSRRNKRGKPFDKVGKRIVILRQSTRVNKGWESDEYDSED